MKYLNLIGSILMILICILSITLIYQNLNLVFWKWFGILLLAVDIFKRINYCAEVVLRILIDWEMIKLYKELKRWKK